MNTQTTQDKIIALAEHDTFQATTEDLQAAYFDESYRYYEDMHDDDLEDLYTAIQSGAGDETTSNECTTK